MKPVASYSKKNNKPGADTHQENNIALTREQLFDYLNNSPLGLIELDTNLNILAWSANTEQIFGWPESGVLGKSLNDLQLTAAESTAELHHSLNNLLKDSQKNTKIIIRNHTRSGKIIYCQWYISVHQDPGNRNRSLLALIDDITDKYLQQENIRKINERFECILRATHDSIWDWDMVNNSIWTNENYVQAFGYDPQHYPNFHEEWVNRIHPDDKEKCLKSMKDSLEKNSLSTDNHFRFKMADGSFGTIFSRSFLIFNESGQPVRWIGAMMDVTQREKAEEALRESEQKYRNLVDSMTEGLGMQDKSGRIQFLNRRACEMLGYQLEELIGKPFADLFDEDNKRIYFEQMALRNQGKTGSYEIEWVRKDGGRLATIINPSLVLNDKQEITGSIAVFTDITKRLEAERKLAESESRLRTILETEPDCIKLLDRNGNVLTMNAAGLKMIEADCLEEATGCSMKNLIAAPYRQAFDSLAERVFNGESGQLEYECTGLKGTIRLLETTAVPLKNENGEVVNMLAVSRDITESKKTLLALQQSEAKFRWIFESELIGFIFYDNSGNITEANTKFLDLVGYTRQDVASGKLSWRNLTPPEYHSNDNEALEQIRLNGSCIPYEKEYIRKDGSRFHLILGAVSINENEGMAYIIDISERKKIEKQLRKSNALLAEAQKLSHVGNWEWFPNEDKVIWSDEMFNILGLEPQQFEVRTDTIFKYIHPDDLAGVQAATREALVSKKSQDIEYRIIRQDGSIRYLYGVGHAFLDKNGELVRMVGSYQDITDRKRAEEQIRKEKDLSDSLINSLPGVFYLFDEHGRFIRWNNNLEKVSGYSAEEIQKMHPTDFFDVADHPLIRTKISENFGEGTTEVEANIINREGKKIPYYFTGLRINFENRTCLIGMGININERKQAEQERLMLASILENTSDFVLVVTMDKKVVFANKAVLRILEKKQLKDLNEIAFNKHIPGWVSELIIEQGIPEAIKSGTWRGEIAFLNNEGHEMPLSQVIICHRDHDGSPQYLSAIGRDITEMKSHSEELQHINMQLRNLTAHLQNIREEERATMAREIHDELGQQLTGLKMDVSWISKKLQYEDEKIRRKLRDLLQLADSTISTVRRLASDLRPSILDDFGLVEALAWQASEFERRTGLRCRFAASIPYPVNDKKISISLFRIFQECLTNVARHAQARNVWSTIKMHSEVIELTITDDGKGFDAGSIKSTQTLGLMGMKERVHMVNGTFHLFSTPGKGTIIRVTVPYNAFKPNTDSLHDTHLNS